MGSRYTTTVIDTGADALQALVPAAAGRSVAVHGFMFASSATGLVKWIDSAATDLSGSMSVLAGVPFRMANSGTPCMTTAHGLGLSIITASTANAKGSVTWSYDI